MCSAHRYAAQEGSIQNQVASAKQYGKPFCEQISLKQQEDTIKRRDYEHAKTGFAQRIYDRQHNAGLIKRKKPDKLHK